MRASDAFLLEFFEKAEVGTKEHEVYQSNMVDHDYKKVDSCEKLLTGI